MHWLDRIDPPEARRLVELVNATVPEEGILGFPEALAGREAEALVEELSRGLAEGKLHVLAASDPEEGIVGTLILEPRSLPTQRHIAEIRRAVIHPSWRGSRILIRALAAIVAHCRTLGVELLTIDVRADTRSERLWRKVGFEEYGRLEDYARVEGVPYAGVFLQQTVAAIEQRLATLTRTRRWNP